VLVLQLETVLTREKIRDYYRVTKPNVITLLVFTGAAAYIAAAGIHFSVLQVILVAAAIWLGSAAANTVGSYFDRDIDAIMRRTQSRPIPSGRIGATHAAVYGLCLLALSLAISWIFLSPYSTLAMAIGFLDYTVVYSYVLKRRSPTNIILGGFSGAMPVLVGYFATPHPVFPFVSALFIAFLVFFWIPEHIWSLAVRFKTDYTNAKIPMLPTVVSDRTAVRVIGLTSVAMIIYSLLPFVFPQLDFHGVYLGFAAVLGAVMLYMNYWLLKNPSPERAWTVFKFSSPYLFFMFIGIVIDSLVYLH
jgi:heme o synthase